MRSLKPNSRIEGYERLQSIYQKVMKSPKSLNLMNLPLKAPFFGKNVQSACSKLGRAQELLLLLPCRVTAPLPNTSKVKQAITGNGNG